MGNLKLSELLPEELELMNLNMPAFEKHLSRLIDQYDGFKDHEGYFIFRVVPLPTRAAWALESIKEFNHGCQASSDL